MFWSSKYHYIPRYEYTGTNQHGSRYQKIDDKRLSVARLAAQTDNATDLSKLILLSHNLNVPVHYDFNEKPNQAYIEVVSFEAIKDIK